jgi:hypothetical protein
MKRASVAGVLAICVGFAGCGGADRDRENAGTDEKTAEVRPVPVSETGCLTARGEQFVLTDLQRGDGEATTETFRLIGNEQELRKHVGQQVRVNGEAEAPKVAVVQESTPPASGTATGTAGAADPKVSTQSETRVEVRQLTVASVEPTGAACSAEGARGAAPPSQ